MGMNGKGIGAVKLLASGAILAFCCWLPGAEEKLPVPLWPEDGRIPPHLQNQYVFLTPDRHAVVVLAPESAEEGGPRRPVRIELHNRIVPNVTACVQESSAGVYLYRYAISNDSAAKDAIERWAVTIPAGTARVKMRPVAGEQHDNWAGADGGPAIVPAGVEGRAIIPGPNGHYGLIAAAQQYALPGAPPGRYARWSRRPDGRAVVAGASRGGFGIESRERPGFTTARFFSGEILGNSIDHNWPEEILKQLSFLDDGKWTEVFSLTLGPMLPPTAPREEAVANFRAGIRRLIETGRLDAKSGFVAEVTEKLNAVGRADLPATALALKSGPSTEQESEVMSALVLTLGLVPAPGTANLSCPEKEKPQ